MSAYIVADATINAIITGAMEHNAYVPNPDQNGLHASVRNLNPDHIGQLLVDENYRSVNHRYREDHQPHNYKFWLVTGRISEREVMRLRPIDYIRICQCYEYQSCEHPEWKSSWACQFVKAVVDGMVSVLPELTSAPWGLDDKDVLYAHPAEAK